MSDPRDAFKTRGLAGVLSNEASAVDQLWFDGYKAGLNRAVDFLNAQAARCTTDEDRDACRRLANGVLDLHDKPIRRGLP